MRSSWFLPLLAVSFVSGQNVYQKPPNKVLDVLNAPLPPVLFPSPSGSHVLIAEVQRYPSIADLAQPWIGLAGMRINPKNNARQIISYNESLRLKNVTTGQETSVDVPPHARLSNPIWSPDGSRFAVVNTNLERAELLVGDTSAGRVRSFPKLSLNAVHNVPVQWTGNHSLLLRLVPDGRKPAPAAPQIPPGPRVQEAAGQAGPVRTYQDLIDNPYEEDLFDHFATTQIAEFDVSTGKISVIGQPAVLEDVSMSGDGKLLLVRRLKRPYSYLHTSEAFPRDIEVWNRQGETLYTVARIPLADNVPIGGVRTGARSVHWWAAEPATVLWVEALDGGDPKRKVPHRDRLLRFRAPNGGEPVEIARFEYRYTADAPIEGTSQLFVDEYDRVKQWVRTSIIDAAQPGQPSREVWSRNINDRYGNPGTTVKKRLANGHLVVESHGGAVFLEGLGATPQGERPFLDRMDLVTLRKDRVFHSAHEAYETFVALASPDGSRIITKREAPGEAPNYFIREANGSSRALTTYADPVPQLRRIRKQLVRYKRPDGVDLSFTLYLPPDYQPGTRLPAVLYAYPTEFTDTGTAGQVSGSTSKFTLLSGISHLFYVLAGYAVLDNTSIPIVGDPETVNTTYVEQLTASAKAAIDKAAEMRVIDPQRVGVIGHSYGAFMTANLLAHTDLFKAGVARSGAYNRTLTPFGFQNERRTYWETPELYHRMSPFSYAHKINEPLLLIHGEKDNNPGTFPVQSERMYQAVRGNGGTVRYVVLPEESHGYQARESVEHTLYEMISWFDRYVKRQERTVLGGTGAQ